MQGSSRVLNPSPYRRGLFGVGCEPCGDSARGAPRPTLWRGVAKPRILKIEGDYCDRVQASQELLHPDYADRGPGCYAAQHLPWTRSVNAWRPWAAGLPLRCSVSPVRLMPWLLPRP